MKKSASERLREIFEKKRDPYLEWHDGLSLWEVDSVFNNICDDEKSDAVETVREFLSRGYNRYAGYAAELLGGEECSAALQVVLRRKNSSSLSLQAAGNLLVLSASDEALQTILDIIGNEDMPWNTKIEALVSLKIATGKIGNKTVRGSKLFSLTQSILLRAVQDDEYLVRYHAAEAVLRISGDESGISEKGSLFAFICGKGGSDKKPDNEDRNNFKKAAEILEALLHEPL